MLLAVFSGRNGFGLLWKVNSIRRIRRSPAGIRILISKRRASGVRLPGLCNVDFLNEPPLNACPPTPRSNKYDSFSYHPTCFRSFRFLPFYLLKAPPANRRRKPVRSHPATLKAAVKKPPERETAAVLTRYPSSHGTLGSEIAL